MLLVGFKRLMHNLSYTNHTVWLTKRQVQKQGIFEWNTTLSECKRCIWTISMFTAYNLQCKNEVIFYSHLTSMGDHSAQVTDKSFWQTKMCRQPPPTISRVIFNETTDKSRNKCERNTNLLEWKRCIWTVSMFTAYIYIYIYIPSNAKK
jgi:hypothetical protein